VSTLVIDRLCHEKRFFADCHTDLDGSAQERFTLEGKFLPEICKKNQRKENISIFSSDSLIHRNLSLSYVG